MSRLKKFIKVQSHRQFALQQLSTDSRMSEEIKQFHSEQVEFADRDGVVKALNFLLGLVKSNAIPISDQIRSQISKLVSLLRIRDELQLHEQIRKREVGNGEPLVLTPECQIEFPHWDETFVMLKMKKFSTTFLEDHRARQELIATILRREAEIERKKADDAESKASMLAQKASSDQVIMQKSMDAAREKIQRAQDMAKEKQKEKKVDATKDKEHRASDLVKHKEERALEVAEKEKRRPDAENDLSEISKAAKQMKKKDRRALDEGPSSQLSHAETENRHSKKKNQKLKVPSEDSSIPLLSKLKTIDDIQTEFSNHDWSNAQSDNALVLSSAQDATEMPLSHFNNQDMEESGFDVESAIIASEQHSATMFQDSRLDPVEAFSGLPKLSAFGFSTPSIMPSAAPCQSPKSVEASPRHLDSFPGFSDVPFDSIITHVPLPQVDSEAVVPIFESHLSNPHYGPWRPFISSSRYLPPVDASQLNVSPYEMALNLSCLVALHSCPVLHVTSRLKNKHTNRSSIAVHPDIDVSKKVTTGELLPLFHQMPTNSKLIEAMNFEEVQLDRALRALRRCTDTSNRLSLCAYEEILNQQRKLLSFLLPVAQGFGCGEEKKYPSSFNSLSVSQQNVCADSPDATKSREHFSKANRLPLKTNLAAQRRQVLLAKFSCPRFSSFESLCSNSADILHLASMAESITNHNRGDPALWKSATQQMKPSISQNLFVGDRNCAKTFDSGNMSIGSANITAKSLLLGNFAQDIKASLNRSFHERYSAAGKSVKW